MKEKVFCWFCHTMIHTDTKVALRDGLPYHPWHTPDKTGKPKLNAKQLALLPDKSKAVM